MLDWILDEAEQVFEGSDPYYSGRRSRGARRTRPRASDRTIDSDLDASSYSSSSSFDSQETKRRYLKQQARILTRKILQRDRNTKQHYSTEYDADESTVDNYSGVNSSGFSSSGASYYFSALNDIGRRNYAVNRTISILDEDSVSNNPRVQQRDDESDADKDEENANPRRCEIEEEEEKRKRNILWRLKRKRKRHGVQEKEEPKREQNDHKLDPKELENHTELAKKQERKKLLIFTIIVMPMIICGIAGLGVFLALTWNADPEPSETDSSGYSFDSKGPTIRFSPSYEEDNNYYMIGDDTTYYTDTADSSDSSLDVQPSSEETVVPIVNDEIYRKHMEAYERWKQEGEIEDDDDSISEDIDLDEYLDEISFGSSNGDQ